MTVSFRDTSQPGPRSRAVSLLTPDSDPTPVYWEGTDSAEDIYSPRSSEAGKVELHSSQREDHLESPESDPNLYTPTTDKDLFIVA